MKVINKLILKHILKYYDETFNQGPYTRVSYRIHHLHRPQMWFHYLKNHMDEISHYISDNIGEIRHVMWFELIKDKFLIFTLNIKENGHD